jgi:Immunity protein 26
MKRPKKARVSDVVAIPLKAGQFIHAIILKDCGLEISNVISSCIEFTEQTFNLGERIYAYAFDTAIKSGLWPVVGNVEISEERQWMPPTRIDDIVNPENRKIYFRGEIIRTDKKVDLLDKCLLYKPEQLVEMLMTKHLVSC